MSCLFSFIEANNLIDRLKAIAKLVCDLYVFHGQEDFIGFARCTLHEQLVSEFSQIVDDAKCIVVTRVHVSVCPRPHAQITARTRM